MRPELASRLSGSADLFEHEGRRPWASLNFVTAHDGMTLEDVVSYNQKRNEANGENNADGQPENHSSAWGPEGETADAGVKIIRTRIKRSLLMTLFGALGTPMLLGGDEFGRSQNGNNNGYCQDNAISWYDWSLLESEEGRTLASFLRRLAALRRRFPRPRVFLHGIRQVAPGVADIDWFDERGLRLPEEDWRNAEGRALILYLSDRAQQGSAQVNALALNASAEALEFNLLPNVRWRVLLDSAAPGKQEVALDRPVYRIEAHAAVMLEGPVSE
jgi:glycogen operon protein